jgi:ATP-binding protein involved in chromosome partitioning
MGSVSFRTYREVTGDDRSQLGAQVAAQRRRVEERLRGVARVVAIMSGKGGVGKSYVTAALAGGLARRLGGGVGVLDADLASPTTGRLLDAQGPLRVDEDGVHPARGRDGVVVCSMDLLLDDGAPLAWREPSSERFVWRGTLEAGALREFLSDVVWGELDVLLVDLPPGTDRLDDLTELVPALAGAIAVTIPSEESRRSVERAMRRASEAGVCLLGVIENMSGYACTCCGAIGALHEGNAGARLAEAFGVPLLHRLPFLPAGRPDAPATLDALATSCLAVLP